MKAAIPNLLSIARILVAPALALLAYRQSAAWFNLLLLAALASDVLDGWLARRWGVASGAGARLDTIADALLMAVILFAIWALHPQVYLDYGAPIYLVVALIAAGHLAALLRFGRLASFHTWLLRAGIALFSAFALVLFLFAFQPWLLLLAALVCGAGALEQLAMIALLRKWRPDIHGGLLQLLRERRESAAGPQSPPD